MEQAGFGADRCEVLHGDEGLARIDVGGEPRGAAGAMMRWIQSAVSDDADHVRRYAEHLRARHYVVGVTVGDDKAARRRGRCSDRRMQSPFSISPKTSLRTLASTLSEHACRVDCGLIRQVAAALGVGVLKVGVSVVVERPDAFDAVGMNGRSPVCLLMISIACSMGCPSPI